MSRHAVAAANQPRHRRLVILGIALVIAAAVIGGIFLLRPSATHRPSPVPTQALSAAAHQAAVATLTQLVARADTVAIHQTDVLGASAGAPLTTARRRCAALTTNASSTTAQLRTCEHQLAVAIGAATAATAGK